MIDRRGLLRAAIGGVAAATLGPGFGQANAGEPLENLKLFVPAAPGGGWDQTARAIESTLKQTALVRRVSVTNNSGDRVAGLTGFANEMVFRGDCLLVAGLVMIIATAGVKPPIGLGDVTPLARLTAEFQVVVVSNDSKIRTPADLAVALTSDVGSLVWAGGPFGGTDHILAGLIGRAVGVDVSQIHYLAAAPGEPIQTALFDGRAMIAIGGWRDFTKDIAAGALRPLGISTRARRPGIDVLTLKEQGLDVELVNWRGVFAPPKLHDSSRQSLTAVIESMAKSLAWHDELTRRGWQDFYLAGDPFARFVANETARIGDILRRLGVIG